MFEHHANTYPLPDILAALGFHPAKGEGRDLFYRSPFRRERTPAFHVDCVDNLWYDFGSECGGDVVDFARAFLASRGLGVSREESLRFLGETGAGIPPQVSFNRASRRIAQPYRIAGISRHIAHPGLRRYLSEERGIPLSLAGKYLVEVTVCDRGTGHVFHTLGMKNDDGGYALHNRHFTQTLGRVDVTVIRGRRVPAREVHVFEDFMDLLSALAEQNVDRFDGDMIVLHMPGCLTKSLAYIDHYEPYQRLYAWLDNDRTGEKAANIFRRVAGRGNLDYRDMNSAYAPFTDVSDYRVERLAFSTLY
ncbi:MAG: toprim domain-containing protein [Ignavibacteriae bacterium]|nr:toprim domain-containing protein [Ignavibacteriota bacterium]MCB9215695.1 toprim domain-containing protein [Ignavibacteria bacterium]